MGCQHCLQCSESFLTCSSSLAIRRMPYFKDALPITSSTVLEEQGLKECRILGFGDAFQGWGPLHPPPISQRRVPGCVGHVLDARRRQHQSRWAPPVTAQLGPIRSSTWHAWFTNWTQLATLSPAPGKTKRRMRVLKVSTTSSFRGLQLMEMLHQKQQAPNSSLRFLLLQPHRKSLLLRGD